MRYIRQYYSLDYTKYTYRRREIPKANGGTRSLGIPSMAWRLYLHGLNHLLLIATRAHESPNQHGFIPGRGTSTAWQQMQSEVIHHRYIYEFDLEKYFDRININYLGDILTLIGLPSYLVSLITSQCRTSPNNNKPKHGFNWHTVR